MTDEKAARLAAIRAQNSAKAPQPASPTSDEKAARLAAIRAQNSAKAPQPASAASSTEAAAGAHSRPRSSAAPSLAAEEPAVRGALVALLCAAVVLGALAATLVMPRWVPALQASLSGAEPSAFWYISRSSALVAYSLLWLSMLWGLTLSGRVARMWPGGPTALDLHQHASILGLAFALLHALILLGDHYIGYSLASVLIPFTAVSYRPLWVGLGQVSLYLMALIVASFYVKKTIGRRAWRTIHYLSFGLFMLTLVHGVASGTDTQAAPVQLFYWFSGGSVLFLTCFRILGSALKPSQRSLSR